MIYLAVVIIVLAVLCLYGPVLWLMIKQWSAKEQYADAWMNLAMCERAWSTSRLPSDSEIMQDLRRCLQLAVDEVAKAEKCCLSLGVTKEELKTIASNTRDRVLAI